MRLLKHFFFLVKSQHIFKHSQTIWGQECRLPVKRVTSFVPSIYAFVWSSMKKYINNHENVRYSLTTAPSMLGTKPTRFHSSQHDISCILLVLVHNVQSLQFFKCHTIVVPHKGVRKLRMRCAGIVKSRSFCCIPPPSVKQPTAIVINSTLIL